MTETDGYLRLTCVCGTITDYYQPDARLLSVSKVTELKFSISTMQVINIINAAQENSPVPVTEALNRVLDILRTTELYSPQFNAQDDPHATDLVGGLMSVSPSPRLL